MAVGVKPAPAGINLTHSGDYRMHDLHEFREATKLDLKELELRLMIKLGAVMVGGLVVAMVFLKLKIL